MSITLRGFGGSLISSLGFGGKSKTTPPVVKAVEGGGGERMLFPIREHYHIEKKNRILIRQHSIEPAHLKIPLYNKAKSLIKFNKDIQQNHTTTLLTYSPIKHTTTKREYLDVDVKNKELISTKIIGINKERILNILDFILGD